MHAFCIFYVAGKPEREPIEQLLVDLLPESKHYHIDGPFKSFSWLHLAHFRAYTGHGEGLERLS